MGAGLSVGEPMRVIWASPLTQDCVTVVRAISHCGCVCVRVHKCVCVYTFTCTYECVCVSFLARERLSWPPLRQTSAVSLRPAEKMDVRN